MNKMRAVMVALAILAAYFLAAEKAQAGPPKLYSEDGRYLGDASANRYDKNSISNPYGKYGSPYEKNSVNNPQGRYGSPLSPDSINNPYEAGRYGNRNRNRGGDE